MKPVYRLLIAVFCIITINLPGFAATPPASWSTIERAVGKQAGVLFVVLAKKGTVEELRNQPGHYKLILTHVDPRVIYFADHPKRASGQVSVERFLTQWHHSNFRQDPPNAVMEAIRLYRKNDRIHKKSVSYAIELTQPSFNKQNNTLTFIIRALPGNKTPIPDLAHSDYVGLFVDNGCLSCMFSAN